MRSRLLIVFWVLLGLAEATRADTLVSFAFDEGAGSTAVNAGTLGAALNGALMDGAGYSTDTPSGTGSALSLTGANDYVRATTAFSYGSALTVEAWIQASALDGQRVIWDDYGNPGVLLAVSSGTLQFGISTTQHPGPGVAAFTPVLLCEDEWIHVAGTYDGAEIRAYVNGALEASTATSGPVIDNPTIASAIGSDNDATSALNFVGLVDDFRIHSTALGPNELGDGLADLGHVCVPEPSLGALGIAVLATLGACRRTARARPWT